MRFSAGLVDFCAICGETLRLDDKEEIRKHFDYHFKHAGLSHGKTKKENNDKH